MQHIARSQSAAPTYLQALVMLIIVAEIVAAIVMFAINSPMTGAGAGPMPMPAPMPAPAPFVP